MDTPGTCTKQDVFLYFVGCMVISGMGGQSLILAGKVSALISGRYNVSLDDIKAVAKPALRHRMALNIRGETEGVDTDELIDEILHTLDNP